MVVFVTIWFSYVPCQLHLCLYSWCICVYAVLSADGDGVHLNAANQVCGIMNKFNISDTV